MKIGILVTGHVPGDLEQKHGAYADMFARLLGGHGFTFEAFHVVDGEFPSDIHACDGWLITGSRHGAYDPLPWIAPLEEFIRKAYEAGVPLAGICFGHQIMAQALGGKVEKYRGGWGVGRSTYRTADGETVELHAMHQDQVTVKPPEAEIIASSEFCENAGFAYKGNAISFQPHPEFSAEFMRDLIDMRAGKVFDEDEAARAIAGLKGTDDSGRIAVQLATFFKQSAKVAA